MKDGFEPGARGEVSRTNDKAACTIPRVYGRYLVYSRRAFAFLHPPPTLPQLLKLRIITTGGTIDKAYFDAKSTYQVGTPQIMEVLAEANVTFNYVVEQAMQKDSLELTDEDRQNIRQRVEAAEEAFVLITHGTDTMADTARCLTGIPGKTIVLTGSMAPARFRASDAVFNIGCAIGACQLASPGVYIAMNGQVFPAGAVRKNREKSCFELG